jgi:hypothetical protein
MPVTTVVAAIGQREHWSARERNRLHLHNGAPSSPAYAEQITFRNQGVKDR